MLRRASAAVLGGLSLLGPAPLAHAGETTLPEPVLQENITDIDALEVGSLEFDLTPAYLRAQHSSAGLWTTGLEAEWRPVDRLGLGAEVDLAGALDGATFVAPVHAVPRASLSYVFFRDFDQKLFLQAEAGGRYDGTRELALIDPTEMVLPLWFGIRGATVLGPIDTRVSVLGEAGGSFVHAPLNTSVAAIYAFEGAARAAVGVEAIADWARTYPLLVAPEAQILTHVFGRPLRVQVAFPVTVGARAADATYGVSFRFVLEPME